MPKEINFLLLGESGAGKSTTLNALANYLKNGSFDDVLQSGNDFIEVVPSHFTLPDPQNINKQWEIRSSFTSANERQEIGRSATSEPTGYCFTFGTEGHLLRIIDTPGIGDTDGVEVNKRNLENIFLFMQTIEFLHGIIIIVKGNESRKSVQFKFCIVKLLSHLHKSAVENIVFCFTHSQIAGTIGIGDGFVTTRSFLNEEYFRSVGINLEAGKNAFFIENDAYRFLLAKQQGYPWKEVQIGIYRQDWDISVKQFHQLFERLLTLPPHSLEATISLNNARKLVAELSTPTVQLEQEIEKLNQEITKIQNDVVNLGSQKDTLNTALYITVTEEKKIPNFTKKFNNCQLHWEGGKFYDYTPKQFAFYKIGAVNRQKKKMEEFVNTKCLCETDVTYTNEVSTRKVLNEDIEQDLNNLIRVENDKNASIEELKKTVEKLNKEKALIREIGSKFAHFINANSTFSVNNYFETFIDMLIAEENHKCSPKTDELYRLKESHKANVQRLTKFFATNSSGEPMNETVTTEDVLKLQKEMLELERSGEHFRSVLLASSQAQDNFERIERNVFTFLERTNELTNMANLFFSTGFDKEL